MEKRILVIDDEEGIREGLREYLELEGYTWDDKIYRGCGLLVPCEFGELDRWLEPLWQEALATVARHPANTLRG